MSQPLSSKVIIVEEEPQIRGIPSAPTSVAGAVGITERGPIGAAELCTSWEEFQQKFGGFTADSDLTLAAMGFFENGGSMLWVARSCHYSDVSDPATATALKATGALETSNVATPAEVIGTNPAPFSFNNGEQFELSINGDPPTLDTIAATAAQVGTPGPGPFALADSQTLELGFEGGPVQTVTFLAANFSDIGAATGEEVAAEINSQIAGGKAEEESGAVYILSDIFGNASQVEIVGGTANATLGFPTVPASGTGIVGNIKYVTITEIIGVVSMLTPLLEAFEAPGGCLGFRTVATGSTASVQVGPATTSALGFDNDLHTGSDAGTADAVVIDGKDPGAYGDRIEVETRPPTSGDTGFFDLFVIEDGVYREVFPNLCMDPTNERYIETVVNDPRTGSVLVRVADQLLAGAPIPDEQVIQLAGGDDGLTGLDDNDFIGSPTGKTGMHALDQVQDLSLLIVPGRATAAMLNAMVSYCETDRDGMIFAVLDPPEYQSATDIVTYVQSTASLLNLSEHAAIYWPRVEVLNPAKSVFGSDERIVVAPSGIICGVYARTDVARPGGMYDPPAGVDKGRMFGVLGFEVAEVLEEAKRDLVYPKRINPLTTGPGFPRYIDGSRTLKDDGSFPYIAERRGVTFIERSLKQGLQFARHKNNDEKLRAQVRRTITAFLITQMNNGAFRSRDPEKAFFVDVSEALNTPTVIFEGKLIVRVGLATNKPAEFIIIKISQDTRQLETELAAAGV